MTNVTNNEVRSIDNDSQYKGGPAVDMTLSGKTCKTSFLGEGGELGVWSQLTTPQLQAVRQGALHLGLEELGHFHLG